MQEVLVTSLATEASYNSQHKWRFIFSPDWRVQNPVAVTLVITGMRLGRKKFAIDYDTNVVTGPWSRKTLTIIYPEFYNYILNILNTICIHEQPPFLYLQNVFWKFETDLNNDWLHKIEIYFYIQLNTFTMHLNQLSTFRTERIRIISTLILGKLSFDICKASRVRIFWSRNVWKSSSLG